MKTGTDTGPCPACGEPDGGRYQYGREWRCWPCLPANWRRRSPRRRPEPEPYGVFVGKVWDRIEEITGYRPFYLDARTIASYCPRCRAGTVRLGFFESPRPGFVVGTFRRDSGTYSPEYWIEVDRLARMMGEDLGRGTCSCGCTEDEIGEAIFG